MSDIIEGHHYDIRLLLLPIASDSHRDSMADSADRSLSATARKITKATDGRKIYPSNMSGENIPREALANNPDIHQIKHNLFVCQGKIHCEIFL
jgi:hypothetical protein